MSSDEELISWWGSKLAVCSVNSKTLQPVTCQDYDPRTWQECEWSKGFEGAGGWVVRVDIRSSNRRQQLDKGSAAEDGAAVDRAHGTSSATTWSGGSNLGQLEFGTASLQDRNSMNCYTPGMQLLPVSHSTGKQDGM